MRTLGYFLLLLFSVVFFFLLSVAGFIYQLFTDRDDLDFYFFGGASTASHSANFFGAALWNAILITGGSVNHFGNRDESMSGVLGKNQRTKTLTKFGRLITYLLNKLDPNHTLDAIEEDEK